MTSPHVAATPRRASRVLWRMLSFLLVLAVALPVFAQSGTSVEIPYEHYQALLNSADSPSSPGYAVGRSQLTVTAREGSTVASVSATVSVEVFENEWTAVRVLPPGVTLTSATVSGRQQQLIAGADGYFWVTRSTGTQTVVLQYTVPIGAFEGGRAIALPVPPGAGAQLTASLPGTGLGVAVIPASTVDTSESGSTTSVTASLPAVTGAQISWRDDTAEGHTLSRASYNGRLEGEAVIWQMALNVDLERGERTAVPVLRDAVSLRDITVDGESAPISTEGGWFTVPVQGRGSHQVVATFEVAVDSSGGPPGISFQTPRVPVSHFSIALPGEKVVTVTPAANVLHTAGEGETLAEVHVSMTNQVAFQWSEAVPEQEMEQEVRASATLYHLAHAEEGVLYEEVVSVFDVSSGQTSSFSLQVPPDAQINRVEATDGSVSDWRVTPEDNVLTVFLNRQVEGEYRFSIFCERSLGVGEQASTPVSLPLFSANDVSRQRGMVALLSSRELGLSPQNEVRLNRVGENQIPTEIRSAVDMTIAHTFRYLEADPALTVIPSAPEREQGRYDVQTDTLVSLGDVTTTVAAAIVVDVKSGSLMSLDLHLPAGVNFLNISAPSMREHEVSEGEGDQVVHVDFTQEMEGTFRIEIAYEQILGEAGGVVNAPLVLVEGADVEQGRVAVEALSAVEVQPENVDHLSTVDVAELPQQLVLRTTNPILLAYRYVQTDPMPVLGLRVTHHQEVEVQDAAIDEAYYRTLYTEDGLAVTMARFVVRNSRQQFLRVTLPENSEVWAATVAGQPETPAIAESEDGSPDEVLINIINSTQGFPVELVYATEVPSMANVGRVHGMLPRPDVVVTSTHWDVFLPEGYYYDNIRTAMQETYAGGATDALAGFEGELSSGIEIDVPESGILFSFEKLYANQTDNEVGFSIAFTSIESAGKANMLANLATVLAWLGLLLLVRRRRTQGIALFVGSTVVALFAVLRLDATTESIVTISMVGAAVVLVAGGVTWLNNRMKRAIEDDTPPSDTQA